MHKYLRAIGFSEIKKEELEKLWEQIEERPDDLRAAEDSEGNEFAELRKVSAQDSVFLCAEFSVRMTALNVSIIIRIFLEKQFPPENRRRSKNMPRKNLTPESATRSELA